MLKKDVALVFKGADEDSWAELLDDIRPQGKWKCTVHSTYRGYYKDGEPVWGSSKVYSCPVCGRRTIVKENFCPSCGTDMREIPLSERIRKFKQEDLKKEVTG